MADLFVKTKARKAEKRAQCPFINTCIIDAADSGNIDRLVNVVETYLQDMNLVNLTTALHRVAKLSTNNPSLSSHTDLQRALHDLVNEITLRLSSSDQGLNASRRQSLSNIVWSLAVLEKVHIELVAITVNLASSQLEQFKPFELASAVWAFGKLGSISPVVKAMTAKIFPHAVQPLRNFVDQLGFRFLSMVAWAYAAAGYHDEHFFQQIAQRTCVLLARNDCPHHGLRDVAWAFSSAGLRHESLLMEIGCRLRSNVSTVATDELLDLSQILFAEDIFCMDFVTQIVSRAQNEVIPCEKLVKVFEALVSKRPSHSAVLGAVESLLPVLTKALEDTNDKQLAASVAAASQAVLAGTSSFDASRADSMGFQKVQGAHMTEGAGCSVIPMAPNQMCPANVMEPMHPQAGVMNAPCIAAPQYDFQTAHPAAPQMGMAACSPGYDSVEVGNSFGPGPCAGQSAGCFFPMAQPQAMMSPMASQPMMDMQLSQSQLPNMASEISHREFQFEQASMLPQFSNNNYNCYNGSNCQQQHQQQEQPQFQPFFPIEESASRQEESPASTFRSSPSPSNSYGESRMEYASAAAWRAAGPSTSWCKSPSKPRTEPPAYEPVVQVAQDNGHFGMLMMERANSMSGDTASDAEWSAFGEVKLEPVTAKQGWCVSTADCLPEDDCDAIVASTNNGAMESSSREVVVRCDIKNTFLEFVSEDDQEEAAVYLPPALDCLMSRFTEEELNLHRRRYRAIRDW